MMTVTQCFIRAGRRLPFIAVGCIAAFLRRPPSCTLGRGPASPLVHPPPNNSIKWVSLKMTLYVTNCTFIYQIKAKCMTYTIKFILEEKR